MAENKEGNLFTKEGINSLVSYLITVREFKGLNRKQASILSGVSYEWLSKFETQKHTEATPSRKQLLKYCNFLGIDVQLEYKFKIN